MEYKNCTCCNIKLPISAFNKKDSVYLKSICKICEYTKKRKYSCEIPPDTKLCSRCNSIQHRNNYKINKSVCFICLNKDKKVKNTTEKKCSKCLDVFPISNFYTSGLGKIRSTCKQCSNKKRDLIRKLQPTERYLIAVKLRSIKHRTHPDYNDKLRAKKYGMTIEDLKEMIVKQDNKCYICNKSGEDNINEKLVIDHCHGTNKVRKLLCNYCNTALGQMKDDLIFIDKIKNYIIEHK